MVCLLLVRFRVDEGSNERYIKLLSGKHANINRKPIVFDPVGVGATTYRRSSANRKSTMPHCMRVIHSCLISELLNAWQATVIKGNAGELAALANALEVPSFASSTLHPCLLSTCRSKLKAWIVLAQDSRTLHSS